MNYLLFTTTRCPKCPEFKKFVQEKIAINGLILDEYSETFSEEISKCKVSNAPTIILFDESQNELYRTSDISSLEDFLRMI
jgi:thioredoxin-related protein